MRLGGSDPQLCESQPPCPLNSASHDLQGGRRIARFLAHAIHVDAVLEGGGDVIFDQNIPLGEDRRRAQIERLAYGDPRNPPVRSDVLVWIPWIPSSSERERHNTFFSRRFLPFLLSVS